MSNYQLKAKDFIAKKRLTRLEDMTGKKVLKVIHPSGGELGIVFDSGQFIIINAECGEEDRHARIEIDRPVTLEELAEMELIKVDFKE